MNVCPTATSCPEGGEVPKDPITYRSITMLHAAILRPSFHLTRASNSVDHLKSTRVASRFTEPAGPLPSDNIQPLQLDSDRGGSEQGVGDIMRRQNGCLLSALLKLRPSGLTRYSIYSV